MRQNEDAIELSGYEGRGFWLVQELTQIRREQQNLTEKIDRLTESVSDLRVRIASIPDRDEFEQKMEEAKSQNEEKSRLTVEILKIVGASIGAAVSALTGVKLLN